MPADSDGNLYVAMYGQGRVLVFNKNGIPIGQILLLGRDEGHNLSYQGVREGPAAIFAPITDSKPRSPFPVAPPEQSLVRAAADQGEGDVVLPDALSWGADCFRSPLDDDQCVHWKPASMSPSLPRPESDR